MKVLGIESSCDETAAAIVTSSNEILANVVSSQIQDHLRFGGVVPEIAARSHLQRMDQILHACFEEAKLTLDDIDGIAVTGGPGLIGGVFVGVMMAKGLAFSRGLPFIPVNHLEAHALTARLTENVEFPYLLLLVSGGHCQYLIVEGVGNYTYLGGTLDDAIGECLDKTARLLGFGYPGGPVIERLAKEGNPETFTFPHPLKGKPGCTFSFSGMKTAARKIILAQKEISETFQADFCASFQRALGNVLKDRTAKALEIALEKNPKIKKLVIAGGVAANKYFKACLEETTKQDNIEVVAPPLELCTDNGAMVAWTGVEYMKLGLQGSLDFSPRPRWPLEELGTNERKKIA